MPARTNIEGDASGEKERTLWQKTAVAIVGVVLVAACSSDDSGADAPVTQPSLADSAPASDAAPTTERRRPVAGPRQTVAKRSGSSRKALRSRPAASRSRSGSSTSSQAVSAPDSRKTAEAAARWANDNLGGIGGRPIELVPCLTSAPRVLHKGCANELVRNDDLVAVVLATDTSSDLIVPIVTGAGIPYVTAVGPAGPISPLRLLRGDRWRSPTTAAWRSAQESGYEKVTMIALNISGITVGIDEFAEPAFEKGRCGPRHRVCRSGHRRHDAGGLLRGAERQRRHRNPRP